MTETCTLLTPSIAPQPELTLPQSWTPAQAGAIKSICSGLHSAPATDYEILRIAGLDALVFCQDERWRFYAPMPCGRLTTSGKAFSRQQALDSAAYNLPIQIANYNRAIADAAAPREISPLVRCPNCGSSVSEKLLMYASLGIACPNCYDDMENE